MCNIEINVPVINSGTGTFPVLFFEAQSRFRPLFSWKIVAA